MDDPEIIDPLCNEIFGRFLSNRLPLLSLVCKSWRTMIQNLNQTYKNSLLIAFESFELYQFCQQFDIDDQLPKVSTLVQFLQQAKTLSKSQEQMILDLFDHYPFRVFYAIASSYHDSSFFFRIIETDSIKSFHDALTNCDLFVQKEAIIFFMKTAYQ